MNKNSKVTNVQANGTWEGQYGLMYKYDITFENGDSGEYSSKSKDQNKFVVGQDADYTFTDGKYTKVKPVSNFQQNGSAQTNTSKNTDREIFIVRQSTLKCATDFICNNGGSPADIIEIAEMFTDFVLKGDKPKVDNSNDMPF
jgi:hypothetical protein